MNTWPDDERHAMTQDEHKRWNDSEYPGTREICSVCDEPTGRCEEDNIVDINGEPWCHDCWSANKDDGLFED